VRKLSDVLSQNQIDELLKNLNSASTQTFEDIDKRISEEKVKTYDFKVPKKFTKEQINQIHTLYESFSRLFSSYLTSITRFYCKVKVLQIEEQRYYEFNNALPDYTMMGNISLSFETKDDFIDSKSVVQFSNFVTFSLIDRLLGGYGKNMDIVRDFTDIEVKIMRGVFEKITQFFSEIFAPYADVKTDLAGIETNARVNQLISGDEVIVLATLEVEYNDVKNVVTITTPAMTMEALLSGYSKKNASIINTKSKRFSEERDRERRSGIIRKITQSSFQMDAILAETTVNLDEILSLQPDDVLLLNVPITQNISLQINNKKLFDGKLGTLNHKKAVKISNVYNNK
jgi:flagellar motor switch protein FliM